MIELSENNELAIYKKNLPDNIKDLTRFVLVGREKLTAVRAEIRAINKLDLASNVRQQKKDEAQMLAGALLDAEVKIGELIKKIPKEPGKRNDLEPTSSGGTRLQELGITSKQSHFFQTMAENKDIVKDVKNDANRNEDLPTRTEVLRRIHQRDRELRDKELKKKRIDMPKDIFQVIYADPPWDYNDKCNEGAIQSGGVNKFYPTMTIDQLSEMDLPKTNNNAVLFLWTTSPLLEDSFKVINSWGFKYKASFIWDKVKHNMGHYNSVRHEFLLICIKGSCTPDNLKLFDSVQSIEKTNKHSQKPEKFYEIIETLYKGKKIEMFARNKRNGWESYGNEI